MTNSDKFKGIFGIYATELWGKPEKEFLEWLNEDVSETNVGSMISKQSVIDEIEYELEMINSALDSIAHTIAIQPLTAYVISDEDGNIKCSNCGSFECCGNYCMNCGAEMVKGESDE